MLLLPTLEDVDGARSRCAPFSVAFFAATDLHCPVAEQRAVLFYSRHFSGLQANCVTIPVNPCSEFTSPLSIVRTEELCLRRARAPKHFAHPRLRHAYFELSCLPGFSFGGVVVTATRPSCRVSVVLLYKQRFSSTVVSTPSPGPAPRTRCSSRMLPSSAAIKVISLEVKARA